jgi:hypothetical protein
MPPQSALGPHFQNPIRQEALALGDGGIRMLELCLVVGGHLLVAAALREHMPDQMVEDVVRVRRVLLVRSRHFRRRELALGVVIDDIAGTLLDRKRRHDEEEEEEEEGEDIEAEFTGSSQKSEVWQK